MERSGRFRGPGHRPLHLVPEGSPGTVRGKFSQACELYFKARRETANLAPGNGRKGVSVELAYRISSSSTFNGNESITYLPCRHGRSTGGISPGTVRQRASEDAGRSCAF